MLISRSVQRYARASAGLVNSSFDLEVYSEVLQDAMFDLMDLGKLNIASGSSITCSPDKLKEILENLHRYRDKVVPRPRRSPTTGRASAGSH